MADQHQYGLSMFRKFFALKISVGLRQGGHADRSHMTGVLRKREMGDRQTGRTPCEDEDRDGSDASSSQGMAKIASEPPERGEKPGTDSPLQPSEGNNTANTLIWTLRLQNCGTINFCFLSQKLSSSLRNNAHHVPHWGPSLRFP